MPFPVLPVALAAAALFLLTRKGAAEQAPPPPPPPGGSGGGPSVPGTESPGGETGIVGTGPIAQVEATKRFNFDATPSDPLKGYKPPSEFASSNPGASFPDQMLERAGYFWNYLASLESVRKALDELQKKDPKLAADKRKVAELSIDQDLLIVLGSFEKYLSQKMQDAIDRSKEFVVDPASGRDPRVSALVVTTMAGNGEQVDAALADLSTSILPNGSAMAVIRDAVAYGVPYNVLDWRLVKKTASDATGGSTSGPTFNAYFYGRLASGECLPVGLCSLITSFTNESLKSSAPDQAENFRKAMSLLKWQAGQNPFSAGTYALGNYIAGWLANAPLRSETDTMPVESYTRHFYELLVAAIGVAVARAESVPVYYWTEVVRAASAGWEGGVSGARASKYPWPGVSGVAFAYQFAMDASKTLKK